MESELGKLQNLWSWLWGWLLSSVFSSAQLFLQMLIQAKFRVILILPQL
jgi:hypothetical protein